jgi:hypothetical protein
LKKNQSQLIIKNKFFDSYIKGDIINYEHYNSHSSRRCWSFGSYVGFACNPDIEQAS